MHGVEIVLTLVALAAAVAALAGRLRVPAPSLLVVAGIVAGVIPGVPAVRVTPDVVSLVVLPPLLYAAAEELPWRQLRQVWRPVTVLAVGLVAASAAAVGVVAGSGTELTAGMAFVLGAVLASTDPVAVSALGRRLPLPARVRTLVQAESLFNDATSLLLFRVAVSVVVVSGGTSWTYAAGQFAELLGVGVLAGLAVAAAAALLRRRGDDPVIETVVALLTPYAAYVLAEALHGSGVTAVVVAGVVLGARAADLTTARVRLQLHAVYGTVVFLLESVVFALIGLQLPALVRDLTPRQHAWPWQALAIAGTLLVIRAVWVFPLSWAARRRERERWSWREPAVVSWAGARGVVPLAAVLSIPLTLDDGAPVPGRSLVLVLAIAVIIVTLVVQGFTLAPLVRRAGMLRPPGAADAELTRARTRLARASLVELEQYADLESVPDAVVDHLRRDVQSRLTRSAHPPTPTAPAIYRRLRRDLLTAEAAELSRLYAEGLIGDETRRTLQRQLDLEHTTLGEG